MKRLFVNQPKLNHFSVDTFSRLGLKLACSGVSSDRSPAQAMLRSTMQLLVTAPDGLLQQRRHLMETEFNLVEALTEVTCT